MSTTEFYIDAPRIVISHLDSAQDSHCDFLVALYDSDENKARTTTSAPMPDRESARANIESTNHHIGTSGYGRYLVSLKMPTVSAATEAENIPFSERVKAYTKIGLVSVKVRKFEGAPLAPDIGYRLLPAFHGKGFATEAAGAMVRWFEEQKGQMEFFGFCDPANEGSKAVLRRIGFEEKGVKDIRGLKPGGEIIRAVVFSKGLTNNLEKYGLS